VARELERRWEVALKHQRQLDDEYERWQRAAPADLSDTAVSSIRALAADLPAVWSASTTLPADRQRVVRFLLDRVVVTVDKASDGVAVALHWVGGAVRSHPLTRPVRRYEQLADYTRLRDRIAELRGAGESMAAVAECLNREGFRPPNARRGSAVAWSPASCPRGAAVAPGRWHCPPRDCFSRENGC
jgi:hypothetical protein